MQPNFPDTTENPRGFGGTPDPEEPANADGSVNATEEEQMQHDLLATRARKMIFGPAKEDILTMLGASEAPSKAMGEAGAMIMKSLWTAAKEGGMEIPSDVVIEAGTEVVDDLNELGKSAGVFKYDDKKSEDSELEQAMLWGVKYYGDGLVTGGEISPEMMQEAQQLTAEGIEEEGGPKAPQQTPIAAGVGQAMQQGAPQGAPPPPSGGLVAGAM